ncbi:hypothetical protein DM02DRAFT_651784 [Periconia macrospinosa]|uniref:BTB domain-containing protein n=1 Tax=Periconia macrospinosa TaxID=97972 RepID=A0A2V1E4N2_9PLEO|nr:hypothetical protein DM02DRAFT_651784 [Periconia macrospinosa]
MASNFAELIQSPRFTFLVGQEKKAIVVHAAAIAAVSQQLDALINNGMKESEERCAKLENMLVDDFIRFCEYAYRGDYTTPLCDWEFDATSWGSKKKKRKGSKIKSSNSPVVESMPGSAPEPLVKVNEFQETVAESEPAPPPETSVQEYEWHEASGPQHEMKPASRTSLRTQFNNRKYLEDGGPKALIFQRFELVSNYSSCQNFTPVFLAHARLYCFAQVHLIAPLKELILRKLHKTLMGFKLYTNRVGDIIKLARCVYSNPDLPESCEDDLKKMVLEYIVCEIDSIGKCEDFVKFLGEGGEFVGDFWRMARNYMV